MAYRATCVAQDPLDYFLQHGSEESHLRISDVILRVNNSPKEIFAHLIRLATNSKWSHSAIVYLVSNPVKGFDNTFLVEALTKGIHIASWRNEVVPYKQFTVGIKRPVLDWYVETDDEKAKHDPRNPEDVHGIEYLRHVRGIAVDQLNGLFDHKTVNEIAALYIERASKKHLDAIPQIAEAADAVATFFKKWDESDDSKTNIMRFICSGLVQYSFFAALRIRIINDMAISAHQDCAISNLNNLHRVIFHPDAEGIIANYVQQVQTGKLDIAAPVPEQVLDLLKTTTPADINNTTNLEWHYVIRKGWVWEIDLAPDGYKPQSDDEMSVLTLMEPEHRS